jgi:hypothetical protein
MVEATLHHLMNDVGVKGAHGDVSVPVDVEAAPAPAPASLPPPDASN